MSSSVQLFSGNTRKFSPGMCLPLKRFHNSGRWFLGSHCPKSSRWLKKRSFARAFSSSRRAPPMQASYLPFSMVSNSVAICNRLRLACAPVSSRTRPPSMVACTLPTTSCTPSRSAKASRNSMVSGKLWPVSMCTSGMGMRAGAKAFAARCVTTMLSLPPLNKIAGRSNCAATSRNTNMDSASSSSK